MEQSIIKDVSGNGPSYQIYIDFEHDDGLPVRLPFPDHRTGRGMYLFGNGARAKQQAAAMAAAAAAVDEGSAMNEVASVDEGGDIIEDDEHVFSIGEEVVAFCNYVGGGGDWFFATITCVNSMENVDGVVERSYDVCYDYDGLTKILPPELIRLRDANVDASNDKKVLSPGSRIIKLFYIGVVGENSPFEGTVTTWNQSSGLYDVHFDDGEDAKIPWKEMHTSNFITVCHDSAASSTANANVKPTSKKKKFVQEITVDRLTRIFTEGELEKSDPTMCDCGSVACSTWNEEINVCVECQEGSLLTNSSCSWPEANYAYLEEWWVELVLRPLLKYKDVVLAFCSVGSAEKFAKLVLGGGIEKLQELFAADKGKLISANPNKFVSNVHASAIYEYFMVLLQQKVERHDLFITAAKKVITGDVNVAECTFGRDITKTNSAAWEFIQQLWLRLCSLGGTNCCKKRECATILYYILLEEMTPLEALSYLQVEESVEDRNLVVGYLKIVAAQGLAVRMGKGEVFGVDHEAVKAIAAEYGFDAASLLKNAEAFRANHLLFTATSKLAARIGMEEDIDVNHEAVKAIAAEYGVDVATLVENVKAFADTHSLFGAKSKLAARIPSGGIDVDELNKMAAQLGMNGETLLDKATEFGDNNRSSIQSTNDKKWETHYSDLVEYHKKYKHCCVKPSEDEQLNTWVKNQRRRISDLSDDRIAKLNELGFVWVVGRGRNS